MRVKAKMITRFSTSFKVVLSSTASRTEVAEIVKDILGLCVLSAKLYRTAVTGVSLGMASKSRLNLITKSWKAKEGLRALKFSCNF